MAGYLSGIVWGSLFTAASLAVVSEMTLPNRLGATAANRPEAPAVGGSEADAQSGEMAKADQPAAEAVAEAPAEVKPPAEPKTEQTAEQTAEQQPVADAPKAETTETATAEAKVAESPTPAAPNVADSAAKEPAKPEAVEAPAETATAAADPKPLATAEEPASSEPAQTQSADKTEADKIAESPESMTKTPVATATAEATKPQPEVKVDPAAGATETAKDTSAPKPVETATETKAAETKAAEPAKADTTVAAGTGADSKTETETEPAKAVPTVDAEAAAAALVSINPAATGSGDEAEMAAMDNAGDRRQNNSTGVLSVGTIGDGDDTEGMVKVDDKALEQAMTEESAAAPKEEPAADTKVAEAAAAEQAPVAEAQAPATPLTQETGQTDAPELVTLTPIPAEAAEDAPSLVAPPTATAEVQTPAIDTASSEPAPAAGSEGVSTQMASNDGAATTKRLPRVIQTEGQRAAAEAAAQAAATPAAATEPAAESAGSLQPSRLRGSAEGVIVNRLPRIGDAPAETPTEADADAEELPPVEKFSADFDNTNGQAVMAVVLVDDGASDDLRKQVADLPFPVAVALDPLAPDATQAAAFYRAEGIELVMLATGLPAGAEAADVEVTFSTHASVLPEVVAVMDPETGGFQNNRTMATLVAPTVKAKGLGLITWDEGLNAGDQVARREGMTAGLIFRRFDEAGNNDTGMRRTLDRAALKAGQDGKAIVTGMVNAQTLQSLVGWSLGAKGQTVAMAPVTSAMDEPEGDETTGEATE